MNEFITDDQFLERIGMISTGFSLEVVNNLRTALAEFSTVPGMVPRSILPAHHVESDLGIHHMDSLDLVDLVAAIETGGLALHPRDFTRIAELNGQDGTVGELALLLLDAFRGGPA